MPSEQPRPIKDLVGLGHHHEYNRLVLNPLGVSIGFNFTDDMSAITEFRVVRLADAPTISLDMMVDRIAAFQAHIASVTGD